MEYLHVLNKMLHPAIPCCILLNFVLFIVLIYYNLNLIKIFLGGINHKSWIILCSIFLIGLLLRLFLTPHQHILYVDEQWYMEAGKDLHLFGYQGYYLKSIGWPFILAVVFSIFGVNNWVALYTSTVLGSLTVINIFLLGYIISKKVEVGIISALMFSLLGMHIRWSGSAETNVPSLFFITLTIFFALLYCEYRTIKLLWLALIGIAFTSQFRQENYIFPSVFLVGIIIFNLFEKSIQLNCKTKDSHPGNNSFPKINHQDKKKFFNKKILRFFIPWIVLIILSLPNLVQVLDHQLSTDWIESDTRGRATGTNFSINNLIENSKNWGLCLFNNDYHPYLFTIFFVIGFIYLFIKNRPYSLFLFTWFVAIYISYFTAWLQTLAGKTRFFMSFYPITVILSSLGIFFISQLISTKFKSKYIKKTIFPFLTVILIALFIPYTISQSRTPSRLAHKLETMIPERAEKDLPKNCIIVANWPTVLESTTNLKVVDINDFLGDPQFQEKIFNMTDCVLFFEDMFCLDYGDFCWQEQENWRRLKELFICNPYLEYNEKSITYTFYKVIKEK